jgi:holin-like protein
MIVAFAAIFACQLIGEFVVRAFALPLPGPVVGMFLLFAALLLRGGKGARAVPAQLGGVADGLLGHLSLLFVPASVGLMRYFGVLEANALTLIAAIALSTALAQAATALTFQFLARSGAQGSGAEGSGAK